MAVVNAMSALYINFKSAVLVEGNISESPFEVSSRVLQGDVLAISFHYSS